MLVQVLAGIIILVAIIAETVMIEQQKNAQKTVDAVEASKDGE
jgi:hypothetical protein